MEREARTLETSDLIGAARGAFVANDKSDAGEGLDAALAVMGQIGPFDRVSRVDVFRSTGDKALAFITMIDNVRQSWSIVISTEEDPGMLRNLVAAVSLLAALPACALPAAAQEGIVKVGAPDQKFIGIDEDNGNVYYNGRNSGRYCTYRTVERFNRVTGYMENRRVRHCGRGMYVD